VVATARNADALAVAIGELEQFGEVLGVPGDVASRADVQKALFACTERFGALDVAVAQAGTAELRTFLEIDDTAWDHILAVNVTGVFYTVQEAARVMTPGAAIVVMASTNAVYPEQHTVHTARRREPKWRSFVRARSTWRSAESASMASCQG
jgi:NAD(P)-dependent dehydrogenase (short-subunit alcohol dehydrogenase family)